MPRKGYHTGVESIKPDTRNAKNADDAVERRAGLIRWRAELEQSARTWRGRELAWSWMRVVSFVGLVLTCAALPGSPAMVAAVAAFCVGLFGYALRRHATARRQRIFADSQVTMVDESLLRLGGQPAIVRSGARPAAADNDVAGLPPSLDDGTTWALTDQERDDLDLYAEPVGLFGLLNRTSTHLGGRRLDAMLNHPCLTADRITARQDMIRWLSDRSRERIGIMAAAAGLRSHDERLGALAGIVANTRRLELPVPGFVLLLWSLFSGIVVAAGTVQLFLGGSSYSFLGLLAVNMAILAWTRSAVGPVMNDWRYMGPVVDKWLILAGHAAAHLPADTELAVLRERSARAAASAALGRLSRTLNWVNIGGAAQTVMNLLFLYDLHLARGISGQVAARRTILLESLSAAAELEALCSLACFAFEQPVACWPEVQTPLLLSIEEGTHPLIPPEEVLPNHLELNARTRTWIITGSNMAGKSTFLRMAGINLLLAQTGSAAAARRMRLCPLRLLTDLRARDNLARHESYYLAEVRQLRRMLAPPPEECPIFGLIDEPFRGTNSEEQAAASLAVVRSLIESPHLFLVATHERRLVELADGNSAANYHFRETLEESGMVFDYRIRPGAARTRNAIRILEREEYPPDIVERAARSLERPGSNPDETHHSV